MRWWALLAWLAVLVAGGVGGGWLVRIAEVSGDASVLASVGVSFMVIAPTTFALLLLIIPAGALRRRPSGGGAIATFAALTLLGAAIAIAAVAPSSITAAVGIGALGGLCGAASTGVGILERRAARARPVEQDRLPWLPMAVGGAIGSIAALVGLATWGDGIDLTDAPFALAAGALLALLLGTPAHLRSLRRVAATLTGGSDLSSVPRAVLRAETIPDAHLAPAREWALQQRAHQPWLIAQTALLTVALLGLNAQSTSPLTTAVLVVMPLLLVATIVTVIRQRRRLSRFLAAHPNAPA